MPTVKVDGVEIEVPLVPVEQIVDARDLERCVVERQGQALEAAE